MQEISDAKYRQISTKRGRADSYIGHTLFCHKRLTCGSFKPIYTIRHGSGMRVNGITGYWNKLDAPADVRGFYVLYLKEDQE